MSDPRHFDYPDEVPALPPVTAPTPDAAKSRTLELLRAQHAALAPDGYRIVRWPERPNAERGPRDGE